jgi:predicted RNase H-like nuclease (RuvC/YqgF family)
MAKTLKEVTVHIERQQKEIANLRSRISTLVDELRASKQELDNFKEKVASDMDLLSKTDRGFWR